LPYTAEESPDSWYVSFNYHHSTHRVAVSLDSSSIDTPSNVPLQITSEMLLILGLIIAALLIFTTTLYLAVRKPGKSITPLK